MAWIEGQFRWAEKHLYKQRTGNSHGTEKKRKQLAGSGGIHIAQVGQLAPQPPKMVHIRFVKKAGMWCKTFSESGKQKQQWSVTKP